MVGWDGFDGEDELSWSGLKGLGLWTEVLVSWELSEIIVEFEGKDEKKLELNWGRPH